VFGQLNYGRDGQRYTSYPALKSGLEEVYTFAKEHGLSVALPYNIGCGLGGGDWSVVSEMIYEIFGGSTVPCEIWRI
jgi:O-acetyl-ADP-ribose deacetylase (regulator of RNase III)